MTSQDLYKVFVSVVEGVHNIFYGTHHYQLDGIGVEPKEAYFFWNYYFYVDWIELQGEEFNLGENVTNGQP